MAYVLVASRDYEWVDYFVSMHDTIDGAMAAKYEIERLRCLWEAEGARHSAEYLRAGRVDEGGRASKRHEARSQAILRRLPARLRGHTWWPVHELKIIDTEATNG